MGKPYASELEQLRTTLEWAEHVDVTPLRQAIETAAALPVVAIGSGGSLTAAHLLATAHRRYARRPAVVVTPLEAATEGFESPVSVWMLSAGGSNVDILNAFSRAVEQEPRQLAVMCGRRHSRLSTAAATYSFVDYIDAEGPAGKDGFLATNSLLGFSILISRAYAALFETAALETATLHRLLYEAAAGDGPLRAWTREAAKLWKRNTLIVLCGRSTHSAAIDLESKFTEAALGHVQIADYRNFAHGRHHWLAKHAATSGVLAFSDQDDIVLAAKTLALLPKQVPAVRIDVQGGFLEAGLVSLIAAFHLVGAAGHARRIDPGRPGVPEFGRRLFNLRVRARQRSESVGVTSSDATIIRRKAGASLSRLRKRGDLSTWLDALMTFRDRLASGRYIGVIFDYDGTLVDTRDRYFPPKEDIAAELRRLLSGGAILGIATGRGASVRRDLQACIPRPLWSNVVIGYYNGAEVTTLDDETRPDNTPTPGPALQPIATALKNHLELRVIAEQSDRPSQITLRQTKGCPEDRLWDIANQVLKAHAGIGASVVRSSHSIDVLAPGVSKQTVLRAVLERGANAGVLTIGDRGRWPGNDFELLCEAYSLSVDEVSVDPATCWNLAPAGSRGPQATLEYLRWMEREPNSGLWRLVL